MSDILYNARQNAINSFVGNTPLNQPKHSYYTYAQRHPDDCVTACFRFLSDVYDQEAPSGGLTFSEALVTAANFGLCLFPTYDLASFPQDAIFLGLTNQPKNHAFLLHVQDGIEIALYDPAKGIVHCGADIPIFEWTHFALVYKPSSLCEAD